MRYHLDVSCTAHLFTWLLFATTTTPAGTLDPVLPLDTPGGNRFITDHPTTVSTSSPLTSTTTMIMEHTELSFSLVELGGNLHHEKVDVKRYYHDFLQRCPSIRNKIRKKCDRYSASCKNKCGTRGGSCRCDLYCTAFKDCCGDFQTECPHQFKMFINNYGTRMTDTHVTCLEGNFPVIERCGSPSGNKTYEQQDFREPILTVNNILFFLNKTVFNTCLPNWGDPHEIRFGHKQVYVKKGASMKGLREFFLRGTVDKNTVVQTKRAGIPRACLPKYVIACPIRTHDDNTSCRSNKSGEVIGDLGLDILCEPAATSYREYDNITLYNMSTHTSGLVESDNQDDQISRSTPQCRILSTNTNGGVSGNLSEYHVILNVIFDKGLNRPTIRMFQGEFTRLNKHLNAYKCNDTTGLSPCYITARCIKGYFPIDLICRNPIIFIAQVVGVTKFHTTASLAKILSDIFKLTEQNFSLFRSSNKMKNIVSSGTEVLTDETGLHKVVTDSLPFSDTKMKIDYDETKLPVTNFIVEQYKTKIQKSVKQIVRRLTLCFMLEEEPYHGRLLLCDRLLPSGESLILDSHFTIPGTELPDPLVDFLDVPSIGSQDRLGMVFIVLITRDIISWDILGYII